MFILPNPEDLLWHQINHYEKLMQNPRSDEHKWFLRKQIYNLKKLQEWN